MNRLALLSVVGCLSAFAPGCRQTPPGWVEIRIPGEGVASLAAIHLDRADTGARTWSITNVTEVASAAVPAGTYRVVLAYANSNFQPPTEVVAGTVAVTPGGTSGFKCGAIVFVVPDNLPDLNLDGILVQGVGEAPSLELKNTGNTYYFFKPKPLPPGTYEIAIRYARSTAPSTVATGVVVAADVATSVTLDSGFVLKDPGGPRIEGWRLVREGESSPWLEVTRRWDNHEPLWRRFIAPPGTYSLVLRRTAPAGESKPETITIPPGGLLTHEPSPLPAE